MRGAVFVNKIENSDTRRRKFTDRIDLQQRAEQNRMDHHDMVANFICCDSNAITFQSLNNFFMELRILFNDL